MRSRGLVAGVLLVAAAVALVVAFTTGGSGNADAAPSAALGTPVVVGPARAGAGGGGRGDDAPATDPRRRGTGDGTCFVVSAGDRTLASHGPDTPLTGASTQKILTAAAALSILGPDTTFDTRVVASSAPTDGTVDRVWLVGGGDPVLSTNDYVSFLKSQPKSKRRRHHQPRGVGRRHRGQGGAADPRRRPR